MSNFPLSIQCPNYLRSFVRRAAQGANDSPVKQQLVCPTCKASFDVLLPYALDPNGYVPTTPGQ
jgi:hypothetical protein